ncbi:37S ribosomal protein subunit S8, mitochondrial [Neoconidiobolus thromboides FSU 785]|nr:37S ribosomal protein subunit S8, mitochondrial [Neoconidiobolus thromboides FSU 785]
MPIVEGLARKTKLPCVHDLCARVQNGYSAKLKNISVPETKMNLAVSQILYQQGFISSIVRGNHLGIDYSPTTPDNVATRRYWLGLKYYQNSPVLSSMRAVSIPSRKIFATAQEFEYVVSGRRVGILSPLQPGEIIIINTEKGVLEIHDAVELKLGGQVLCRAK